jgi:hypothetical protein
MNITSDFFVRMVGAQDGYRIPALKGKADDTSSVMPICLGGEQQNFVDLSRCINLSPKFLTRTLPLACSFIMYLDISYTKADDLTTVYTNCLHLKVLNLAGLQLLIPTLKGIQKLTNLEVISIRSSNIQDISGFDDLLCLRSIDCGELSLKKVQNALKNKDRLEELLFDSTRMLNYECISDVMDELSNLTSLKLFNITNSGLAEESVFIKDILGAQPVYYEPRVRRLLFLQAIVVNNVEEAYFYLSSGQNIDVKIEKSDEGWLSDIWIKRCYYAKTRIQTPFFIFNPVETMGNNSDGNEKPILAFDHFPTALHLALFFNAEECVQMLLDNGASLEQDVYISDVLYEKTQKILYEHYANTANSNPDENNPSGGRKITSMFLMSSSETGNNLVHEGLMDNSRDGDQEEGVPLTEKEESAKNQRLFLMKKVYSLREYVQYLYQKNVHRFTENLILKKASNWKSICDKIKKRLLYLIDTYDPKKADLNMGILRGGNESFNFMTVEQLAARNTFAINIEVSSKSVGDSMMLTDFDASPLKPDVLTEKGKDGVPIGKVNTMNNGNAETNNADSVAKGRPPRNVSFGMDTTFQIPSKEEMKNANNNNLQENFKPEELPIIQAMIQSGMTPLPDNNESTVAKERPTILPAKPHLFPWKQHGLVFKIIGPPKVIQINEEVAVEGKTTSKESNTNSWMMPNEAASSSEPPLLKSKSGPGPQGKAKVNRRQTRVDKELAELEKQAKDDEDKKKGITKRFQFKEISLLGKKAFWLESKRKTIEEQVLKREESEIYPRIGHVPLLAQKKQFLQTLKYRLEKDKYKETTI